MGIVLLLGAVFGLVALAASDAKKPGEGSGKLPAGSFVPVEEGGQTFAAATEEGRAWIYMSLAWGKFFVLPDQGQPSADGTQVYVPMMAGDLLPENVDANTYVAMLTTSGQAARAWIDAQTMSGLVFTDAETVLPYPMVLFTTSVQPWPPAGAEVA